MLGIAFDWTWCFVLLQRYGLITEGTDSISSHLSVLCYIRMFDFKVHIGKAGEMAQQSRAPAALVEDLDSVPSTSCRLTAVSNSSSRDLMPSPGLQRHQTHVWFTDIHAGTHTK